jgi:hypothetical protein
MVKPFAENLEEPEDLPLKEVLEERRGVKVLSTARRVGT